MTRFSPGERVRIRDDFPAGHVRTPVYLRGKIGIVDRCHGEFINAETAAYGLSSPRKALYKVCFRSAEIWSDYAGSKSDGVEADLYEHWLERIA